MSHGTLRLAHSERRLTAKKTMLTPLASPSSRKASIGITAESTARDMDSTA